MLEKFGAVDCLTTMVATIIRKTGETWNTFLKTDMTIFSTYMACLVFKYQQAFRIHFIQLNVECCMRGDRNRNKHGTSGSAAKQYRY